MTKLACQQTLGGRTRRSLQLRQNLTVLPTILVPQRPTKVPEGTLRASLFRLAILRLRKVYGEEVLLPAVMQQAALGAAPGNIMWGDCKIPQQLVPRPISLRVRVGRQEIRLRTLELGEPPALVVLLVGLGGRTIQIRLAM